MRIVLSGELLQEEESSPLNIVELISGAVRSRHVLEMEDEPAWERWLAARDQDLQRELMRRRADSERLARELPSDGYAVRVVPGPTVSWQPPSLILGVEDALRWVREPLRLMLENDQNDLVFLRRIAPPTWADLLAQGLQDRWLEEEHGGGSTIDAKMKARAVQGPLRSLRTFVVFDSDRLHPDELAETWDDSLPGGLPGSASCGAWTWERTAKEHFQDRHHRWERRFIESYMPIEQLKRWCDRQDQDQIARQRAFTTFRDKLTATARRHFPMKGGLQGDGAHLVRHRDLYAHLGERERATLANGFGRKLASWYNPAENDTPFVWDDDARDEADRLFTALQRIL